MRNKKIPSMVAVGVSLLAIGYIGAKQIDSVENAHKQTEKSTVAAYEAETNAVLWNLKT